jgi:hypothetical protein
MSCAGPVYSSVTKNEEKKSGWDGFAGSSSQQQLLVRFPLGLGGVFPLVFQHLLHGQARTQSLCKGGNGNIVAGTTCRGGEAEEGVAMGWEGMMRTSAVKTLAPPLQNGSSFQ